MVIITHDEEFVRYLNRADCAEYFYRITRDEKYVRLKCTGCFA
jgi:DNA repair exonuclease SbcCD ATPase subunit